jgi:hypothetical protein
MTARLARCGAATLAVVLGLATGLAIGGCWCPGRDPVLLASGTFTATVTAWGDMAVDGGALRGELDLEAATVVLRFSSDAREVVQTYRITSTETR